MAYKGIYNLLKLIIIDTITKGSTQLVLMLMKTKKTPRNKWNTKKPWKSKEAKLSFKRHVWASKSLFRGVQHIYNSLGLQNYHYRPYLRI